MKTPPYSHIFPPEAEKYRKRLPLMVDGFIFPGAFISAVEAEFRKRNEGVVRGIGNSVEKHFFDWLGEEE